MKEIEKIQVVNLSDEVKFVQSVNDLLYDGWEILSINIGFVNSEKYDFCSSYMAVMGLPKERNKKPRAKNEFTPPTIGDVKKYFKDNGYADQCADKFFTYYETANWKDSGGKPVKNWKQKAQGVWFKDENKIINGKKETSPYSKLDYNKD